MDIRELVMVSTNGQMSARPGCYSGRGATTSDLNANMLNQIADAIKKEYGDQAHNSYVKMVWEMPSLSATAFLTNLYRLAGSGWDLSKVSITSKDDNFENHSEALGFLMETLAHAGSDRPNQTESIRNGFRKVK